MDEAAESVSALDAADRRAQGAEPLVRRFGRCEMQRSVGSVGVVVVDEDAEHMFALATVHDQEPVEAFGADGADKALGDRVGFRRSQGCLDDLDAFAGEDRVEVAAELAVAVADQEAKR